jgi:uncharacterized protein YjbI with pentapeptide repeats
MGTITWPPNTTLYALLGLLALVLGIIWWLLPKWQVRHLRFAVRDAKARADLEDNFRKTLSQLIGGAAVLVGAAFAYYQSQIAIEQSQTAVNASRDLLISQQVSRGFEQLGSTVTPTRLGGVYALEGVMNTSEQYHWSIVEALSAVLRDESPVSAPQEKRVSSFLQTIVTVLGRRNTRPFLVERYYKIDLSQTNLRAMDLGRADFSRAIFRGADLSGAYLRRSNLSHCDLRNVSLRDAFLKDINLYFAGLSHADLTSADLTDASLVFARLSFAKFDGAKLIRANLSRANLSDTDLGGADLTGANMSDACGNEQTKLPAGITINPCPKED